MKRRRLLEAENGRLRESVTRMDGAIADLRAQLVQAKAETDAAVVRAARAEAKQASGMCPDRATCLATCSAADAWRNHQREAS